MIADYSDAHKAVAGATLISQGQWLGIDVGSNCKKVFNFCLIKSDGKGQVDVLFEVGKVRGPAHGQPFPPSDAGVFEDLTRATTWLSAAAEAGSIQILDQSALVNVWNAARKLGNGRFGVCIDAPCGFAVPGSKQRNTEMESYGTPPLVEFLKQMKELSEAAAGDKRKNTPLRQKFFWKLVGLVAFRYFVALTTGRPFGMPIPELTASCMASDEVRVREGFPSDTYKRANGRFGVLCPAPRGILLRLSQAQWAGQGNHFNTSPSAPNPDRMTSLLEHQKRLKADLQDCYLGSVAAMEKICNDPPWADLWDAFTCAFVSCCDAQGCGGFVCSDLARGRLEGAILRPDYCSR
jgi:hypothetical protein